MRMRTRIGMSSRYMYISRKSYRNLKVSVYSILTAELYWRTHICITVCQNNLIIQWEVHTHIMRHAPMIVESKERRYKERSRAAPDMAPPCMCSSFVQVIAMPSFSVTIAPLCVHSLSDCSLPLQLYAKPW